MNILKFFINIFQGKKGYQFIFNKLLNVTIKGLNIGEGEFLEKYGENHSINKILSIKRLIRAMYNVK